MAGFDMDSISVIEPGHKQYDQLDVHKTGAMSRHVSTMFYNEVVEALNACEVDSIILVPLPPTIKFYNLRNVLANRGLANGVDILIGRQECGSDGEILPRGERPVKIKKLCETEGRVIDSVMPEVDDEGSSSP
ncbi:MAG: hypothetical protein C0610_17100 [Desulfobacteraceae bacterium]|nr:MAG: hypothetical protein C0610_17100 [Desulfobacteraceae bacterium]